MITKKEYIDANLELENLLKELDLGKNVDDKLVLVSNIIEEYEQANYPINLPTLNEVIELRMFEMKLKQKDLAVLLNTTSSRISEIFKGKRNMNLSIAKLLHKKLNIDSDIILQ
jgi:HTH-type transcriptional regulator/antitoxin HigA